jgi:hypothetical protein
MIKRPSYKFACNFVYDLHSNHLIFSFIYIYTPITNVHSPPICKHNDSQNIKSKLNLASTLTCMKTKYKNVLKWQSAEFGKYLRKIHVIYSQITFHS